MPRRAHHFGVTVSNLDRAVEFYRDALGLDVLDRFTVSGSAFAEGVGVSGATGRFAHLDAGGARVELVEYTPEGPRTTESGTHICFLRDPDGNLVELLEP